MTKEAVFDILVNIVRDEEMLRNDPNVDLIENNLLDSLAFIELLTFLDDEYGVEIQPTSIDLKYLRTINSITELVNLKLDENK